MRVLEAIRRRPVAAACATGALIGAMVGLFLPIRAPEPPKQDAAEWNLPSVQSTKRFHLDQYQRVRSARFWGALATPGARRATASNWTLNAILTRPVLQAAVTVQGKRDTVWVRLGGVLPDGATLVSATRDAIRYQKDGCTRERALYPDKKDAAAADACIGAPAAALEPVPRGAPASPSKTP